MTEEHIRHTALASGKDIRNSVAVNIARLVVGMTFVFSGFVKAVDPLGFQYKLQDYLYAITGEYDKGFIHDWGTLFAGVALSTLEFIIGIMLIFAIHRHYFSKISCLFMGVMTLLTLWIFATDPVSDCGCFGDAVKLSNGETLLKNIVLLALCVVIALKPKLMPRLISRRNGWIVSNYSSLFIVIVSAISLYDLPIIDFRPFHIGADIRKQMEVPEGAPQPEFRTTLTYAKDGVEKVFEVDNLPDSTWTFVSSHTMQTSKGYEPPIQDFTVMYKGSDITEDLLDDDTYTFLLIAPHLETADDTQFAGINQISDYAKRLNYRFLCLTASGKPEQQAWTDMTGAEYEFANADETTLKTVIRSSPGLLLMRRGVIYRKWSHNRLPDLGETAKPLEKTAYAKPATELTALHIGKIFAWYLLPLIIITFLDRLTVGVMALIHSIKSPKV